MKKTISPLLMVIISVLLSCTEQEFKPVPELTLNEKIAIELTKDGYKTLLNKELDKLILTGFRNRTEALNKINSVFEKIGHPVRFDISDEKTQDKNGRAQDMSCEVTSMYYVESSWCWNFFCTAQTSDFQSVPPDEDIWTCYENECYSTSTTCIH